MNTEFVSFSKWGMFAHEEDFVFSAVNNIYYDMTSHGIHGGATTRVDFKKIYRQIQPSDNF